MAICICTWCQKSGLKCTTYCLVIIPMFRKVNLPRSVEIVSHELCICKVNYPWMYSKFAMAIKDEFDMEIKKGKIFMSDKK